MVVPNFGASPSIQFGNILPIIPLKRQWGQRTDKQLSKNFDEVQPGQRTSDLAAKKAGFGNHTEPQENFPEVAYPPGWTWHRAEPSTPRTPSHLPVLPPKPLCCALQGSRAFAVSLAEVFGAGGTEPHREIPSLFLCEPVSVPHIHLH
jgi:hypothetical protein